MCPKFWIHSVCRWSCIINSLVWTHFCNQKGAYVWYKYKFSWEKLAHNSMTLSDPFAPAQVCSVFNILENVAWEKILYALKLRETLTCFWTLVVPEGQPKFNQWKIRLGQIKFKIQKTKKKKTLQRAHSALAFSPLHRLLPVLQSCGTAQYNGSTSRWRVRFLSLFDQDPFYLSCISASLSMSH